MPLSTDVSIQSVELGDEFVQVSYVEHRDADRDTGIMEMRVLIVPRDVLDEGEMEDLIDSCRAVLDKAKLVQRNPPATFTRPR